MPSALLTAPLPQSGKSLALWRLERGITPPHHPPFTPLAQSCSRPQAHTLPDTELFPNCHLPSYTKGQRNQPHFSRRANRGNGLRPQPGVRAVGELQLPRWWSDPPKEGLAPGVQGGYLYKRGYGAGSGPRPTTERKDSLPPQPQKSRALGFKVPSSLICCPCSVALACHSRSPASISSSLNGHPSVTPIH